MLPTNDQGGPNEEFAPNAFSAPPRPSIPPIRQPSQYATEGPKWYDRILDVVLGEDETQAKNRVALICQSCKLVNGQAPPGARTLEDIGRWRCGSCHAWNGVDSEEKRILQQISQGGAESPTSPLPMSAATDPGPGSKSLSGEVGEDDEDEDEVEDDEAEEIEIETPPAGSTRSKARQRKKA